MGGHIVP